MSAGVSDEQLELLRELLKKFKDEDIEVHVSINDGRVRIHNASSKIVGVYEHFISLKSQVKNYYETFTIKLVDFLIKKAKIKELDEYKEQLFNAEDDEEFEDF